jgi:hypothetical protein
MSSLWNLPLAESNEGQQALAGKQYESLQGFLPCSVIFSPIVARAQQSIGAGHRQPRPVLRSLKFFSVSSSQTRARLTWGVLTSLSTATLISSVASFNPSSRLPERCLAARHSAYYRPTALARSAASTVPAISTSQFIGSNPIDCGAESGA